MEAKSVDQTKATLIDRATLSEAIAEHYQNVPMDQVPGQDQRLRDPNWVFDALVGYLTGRKILFELGIKGKYYLKEYNGKQYVIIQGYAGLRSKLNAPRYLATNPKMVHFGLGKVAESQFLKRNAIVSVAVVTTIEVAEYFLSDDKTLSELSANVFFVGAAAAAATFFGSLAGTALVAATGFATVGIVGGIVVSIAIGETAGFLNDQFGIVDRLSGLIDRAGRAFEDREIDGDTPYTPEELDYVMDRYEDGYDEDRYNEQYEDYYDDWATQYDGYDVPDYGYDDYGDYDGGYGGYDYDDGGYDYDDGGGYRSADVVYTMTTRMEVHGRMYTVTVRSVGVKIYKK